MIEIMSPHVFAALLPYARSRRQLTRGQYLFHRNDAIRSLYLLGAGVVALTRTDADGKKLVLHRASGPAIVAEASLYSKQYHCDCLCEDTAVIHRLPVARAREILNSDAELAAEWQSYLAAELQATRYRCELLTRNTIAERLAGWIDWYGGMPAKGKWKALAAELAVSPEALYREIKKRRIASRKKTPHGG